MQLAGDLAGTAAAPTVAKVNGTTPAATGLALLGAASAAAAKTTLALVKADVGLGSVDNTSDAAKAGLDGHRHRARRQAPRSTSTRRRRSPTPP